MLVFLFTNTLLQILFLTLIWTFSCFKKLFMIHRSFFNLFSFCIYYGEINKVSNRKLHHNSEFSGGKEISTQLNQSSHSVFAPQILVNSSSKHGTVIVYRFCMLKETPLLCKRCVLSKK